MQSIEIVEFAGIHSIAEIMPQSYGADPIERIECAAEFFLFQK